MSSIYKILINQSLTLIFKRRKFQKMVWFDDAILKLFYGNFILIQTQLLKIQFTILFWPFVTSKYERQIAVRSRSQAFATVRSGSPLFAVVRHCSKWFATVRSGSQPFAVVRL
jgi:hypothetical protein